MACQRRKRIGAGIHGSGYDGTAPARGVAGTSVNFDGSAVAQCCTGSGTYDRTFGDTTSTSGQHVAHTCASSGTYNWGMTVGVGNQTCTDNGSIYICPVISLAPATLPGGAVRTAYSQTITASGGTGPYGFAVTAGALPDGLTLSSDGTLSGTPTVVGTFNFTVRATDVLGCTGSRNLSLTINCPEVSPAGATHPARLVKSSGSTTEFYLYFQRVDGGGGSDVY